MFKHNGQCIMDYFFKSQYGIFFQNRNVSLTRKDTFEVGHISKTQRDPAVDLCRWQTIFIFF